MDLSVGILGAGVLGTSLKEIYSNSTFIYRKPSQIVLDTQFDVVLVCAPSGLKWFANQHPEQDYNSVCDVIQLIDKIKASRFILVSTIDCIAAKYDTNNHYGANRRILEKHILNKERGSVVRLGALISPFLKKNFLHDIKVQNHSFLPNRKSSFQFSNLYNIEELFNQIMALEFEIFNFFSEPFVLNDLFNVIKGETRIEFFNESNKVVKYSYHNTNYSEWLIELNQALNSFSACSESVQKYLEI